MKALLKVLVVSMFSDVPQQAAWTEGEISGKDVQGSLGRHLIILHRIGPFLKAGQWISCPSVFMNGGNPIVPTASLKIESLITQQTGIRRRSSNLWKPPLLTPISSQNLPSQQPLSWRH
jgi:hypothetical protein